MQRIVTNIRRRQSLAKQTVNSQRAQIKSDYAGQLSDDKKKVSIPDEQGSAKAAISGTPASTELAIRIGSGVYYVVNQYNKPRQISGSTRGFLINQSFGFSPPLSYKYKYTVQNVQNKDKQYEIDTYGVTGLPAPTVDTGDYVTFVGFSNSGRHILVAGVVPHPDDRDKVATLYWGILKDWKLHDDGITQTITYTLESGTKDINRTDFTLTADPGNPGPSTLNITFNRDQAGTGLAAGCPINPSIPIYGATLHVTAYKFNKIWRLQEIGIEDPQLHAIANPGADLQLTTFTFGFSENAAGDPIVDFAFSYASTYRRFTLYNVHREEIDEEWKVLNEQYDVLCVSHCLTTYEKKINEVTTFTYGPAIVNTKFGDHYTSDPCKGYTSGGFITDQHRTVSVDTTTTLECHRRGAGTGDFCISGDGTCTDPAQPDFMIACPSGSPTCYYKMQTDCDISPNVSNYSDDAALPGCILLPANTFNFSMLENITHGIMVMEKLNTFLPVNTKKETWTRNRTSLLRDVFETATVCDIPIVSWPGPVTSSGTFNRDYLTRDTTENIIGDIYDVLDRKIFRDPSGASALLIRRTSDAFIEWVAPFGTFLGTIGTAVDINKLAANDQDYVNPFTGDPDITEVRATYSDVFRTIKDLPAPPGPPPPSPPPDVELRYWKKRSGVYYPDKRVVGYKPSVSFVIVDWIIKP